MKKFLVSLLCVLPLCGFAQKGSQGISVNLGFETCSDAFDATLFLDDACKLFPISVKYHNHLTDHIRIAPYMEYIAADEDGNFNTNVYDLGISFHYFFNKVKRLRPYVVVGGSIGGYNSVVYHPLMISDGSRDEEGELIFEYYPLGSKYKGLFWSVDCGLGLDYKVGEHFSLQMEVLGTVSSSWVCMPLYFGPNIGLTYVF